MSPDLEAFVRWIGAERVWGQVLIRRAVNRFELRHAEDATLDPAQLRAVEVPHLRALAQFTESESFRPLKSAPNLRRGWIATTESISALGEALRHLYPGSIADWHAATTGTANPTHYREYVARQTGMYRITQLLDDAEAAAAIGACCDAAFCLKRRLWTCGELNPDPAASKCAIPCLEPCAVLLEFVRRTVRLSQERKDAVAVPLAPADIAILLAALDSAQTRAETPCREADFSAPSNPRLFAYLRRRLESLRATDPAPHTPPPPET